MFSFDEPYTASFEEKMGGSHIDEHVPFLHMSKLLMEITVGTPDVTVEFDKY